MDAVEMLRRQRASRHVWYELDEPARRALLLRRPNENEVLDWKSGFGKDVPPELQRQTMSSICRLCVIGWRNFTEADLLGADQAPADTMAFTPEVFAEWVQDDPLLQTEVAKRAVEEFSKWKQAKADGAKNSEAS